MWTNIKNAIFVDEAAKAPQAQAAAPVATSVSSGSAPAAAVVSQDNTFIELLRKVIKSRSTAFTALLDAADKLSSIIPDPTTRLKAAYATVASEGRGLKEMLGAIDAHNSDLEANKMSFTRSLETQRTAALSALESEKAALEASAKTSAEQIAAMQQQIQHLQQLISTNTTRAIEISTKIQAEEARFATTAQQFETALVIVRQELEGQRSAIGSTLTT